jgi:uroporphyrin-III C-methyltransferase/precorrin-2 dehydrogenase/sirohydrochlorin ferrochelatase
VTVDPVVTDATTRFRFFPVSYDVAGRGVLVAGDGEQALQKLRLLVRTEAHLTLYAAAPEPTLVAFAAAHGVRHEARSVDGTALAGAALLFVATGDAAEDAALSAAARRVGVPVNVADRPELSDFAVPAIVDRAPIAVAIATDGVAPVLAQRVRAVIEAVLPPGFGRLGQLAAGLRERVRLALPEARDRRRFWHGVFDGAAASAALRGDMLRAHRLALQSLYDGAAAPQKGRVLLVGAGPGSTDLLTLRAQRALGAADVIVHDDLVPDDVIAMGRRDAERIAVGKRKGRHSVAQADIDALLVARAQAGQIVVRLKAGDPLIFGRAGEEIAALRAAGVDYEIVPGVTAALAAAADAAIPLTLRGVASHLVFATGHGAEGAEPEGWELLAASGATVAMYMGRTVADRIAARLTEAGLSGATPVVAIEEAGRTTRRTLAGTLAELPALATRDDIAGPVLILLGEAVGHGDLEAAEPFTVVRKLAA